MSVWETVSEPPRGDNRLAEAKEIRMNYAQERLSHSEVAVKTVADELGYRHANDLSRAYKSYFGVGARMARPASRPVK